MINDAETRIRAERRMGEMLRDQEMNRGGVGRGQEKRSHDETEQIPSTASIRRIRVKIFHIELLQLINFVILGAAQGR